MFLGLKPLKSCYTVWEHDPAWKMLRFGPRNPLRHVKPRISTQNRIRSTRDEEITNYCIHTNGRRRKYHESSDNTGRSESQQRREFYTRARRLSTRIVHDTVPHATRDTALTQSPSNVGSPRVVHEYLASNRPRPISFLPPSPPNRGHLSASTPSPSGLAPVYKSSLRRVSTDTDTDIGLFRPFWYLSNHRSTP